MMLSIGQSSHFFANEIPSALVYAITGLPHHVPLTKYANAVELPIYAYVRHILTACVCRRLNVHICMF